MLNRVIGFSLKNRAMVVCVALMVAVAGLAAALRMPIDVLPDLNRPTVTIITEAHAMVPENVERLVTLPLEQTLNGATGVSRVRSQSGLGLSVIIAEFDWGTDIYRNRQIVQEKLQLAATKLPPGIEPQMAPISSIMGQIQLVGLRSRNGATSAADLRALADGDIRYRLLALPGVANVVASGGAPRQLQVIVDADKLRTFDVTLDEVAEAVRAANVNASGGFLNIGSKGPVITVTGLVQNESELSNAVVRPDPVRPVRMKDIARVDFGPSAIRVGDAGIDGGDGVILVIFKQPGADTVALTERVNEELEHIQDGLPEDVAVVNDIFQQAAFIHRAVDNVLDAVRDGGFLVVVILFLFLFNLRTTFITLTAIPLSVAVTALVFAWFDMSINTMTLGGLAVAIGALVDDAIVDVENVFRRLKQNAASASPRPALEVVFQASSEVRKPIVIGTILVIVVYVPLFFLSGLEGRLFTPIGIAYIVSVAASLLVSLTVTPALCFMLLGDRTADEAENDTFVVRKLKAVAETCIRFSLRRSGQVLAALAVCVALGLVVLQTRGSQFLPEFNEGVAQINLILPPETGLDTSNDFGRRLENILCEVEGVSHVGRRTGRAEGDEHAEGVNTSELIVNFDPESHRSREEIVDEIRARMAEELPGAATAVDQPLAHLISHMLSGVKAQVAIKIFGPDLDTLRTLAKEVEAELKPIPGVKDLFVEPQVLVDSISVEPDRERLARFGLSVRDVAETVELALGGERVSEMTLGRYTYPIIVRLEEKDRMNLDSVRKLYLRVHDRELLLLSDVADVRMTKTPNNINKENVSRRIVVQHNVAGRSLGEVVADVRTALAPLRERMSREHPGYSIRLSGQFEAQAEATRRIALLSVLSLAIMAAVLYMHFKSLNFCAQVLMSIPMAFVGAVALIGLSGQPMSVATLVGLISLGGIAARNAILLLDHYLHLMREENEPFGEEMIVRAGRERMIPVMMTALTSGIGLLPLALSPGEPGRELLNPVATVIIGGLVSSTLLDFIVRPAMFWRYGRAEAERVASLVDAEEGEGF